MSADDQGRLRAFRTLHQAWLDETAGGDGAGDRRRVDLDREVATSLRALGYFD